MIKGLLLFHNLLGILFSGSLFPVTVNVSQTAPSTAQINNSVLVQVTINKGDLNGSAKFAEQLPAGFNAVAIDDEGAQTSFDSNTIAFSWNSLPTDGVINVSFRVDITSAAALQNYVLNGKFFYTANGQNSEADCAPSNITITSTAVVQGNGSSQPSSPPNSGMMTQGSSSPQTMPVNNNAAQVSSSPQVNNTSSSGSVFVTRQFFPTTITPKTDSKVTLTIHKGAISGFAKIEDSIPPGFVAKPGDLNGASFTFVDNRAKFVWGNLPSDSVVTASYRMSANANVPGTHIVVGNFSYLYNDNPLSVSIGSSIFNSSIIPGYDFTAEKNAPPPTPQPIVVAQQRTPPPPSNNNNATTEQQNTPPPTISNPPANTIANNTPPVQANTNTTPARPQTSQAANNTPTTPTSGITYRVQILALRNPINISSYLAEKKIKGHVNTEVDGGFTKYTIGTYTDYTSVKAAKDDLKSKGLDGAFVVCYKSGVRISLQEALKN